MTGITKTIAISPESNERIGALEVKYDSIQAQLSRIEDLIAHKNGPGWPVIAGFFLSSLVVLGGASWLLVTTLVSPVAASAQFAVDSVVRLSSDQGRADQSIKNLDDAVHDIDLRVTTNGVNGQNTAEKLAYLEGRLRLESQ